jgi:hypothetical protein
MKCDTVTERSRTIVDGDYCVPCFQSIIVEEGIPAFELCDGTSFEPLPGYIALANEGEKAHYYYPATGMPYKDYFMPAEMLEAEGYEAFCTMASTDHKVEGVCRRLLREMEQGYMVGISMDESNAFEDKDVKVVLWHKKAEGWGLYL